MKRIVVAPLVLFLSACGPAGSTDLCKSRTAGELVITEFMANPDGNDSGGEWFELYNTKSTAIDLKGLTLYTKDASGAVLKTHTIRAGTIQPNGYFAVGDVRSGPNPEWIGYAYGADLGALPQSAGTFGIRCGAAMPLIIAEYTYGDDIKSARSRSLGSAGAPTAALSGISSNWCDAPLASLYDTANAGTPGKPNPACSVEDAGMMLGTGNCFDVGRNMERPIVKPDAGALVITEVMADTEATAETAGEWFEIGITRAFDLNGLVLGNDGTTTATVKADECLPVQPNTYMVFARNADQTMNGGVANVAATFSFTLANSGARYVRVLSDGDELDRFAYTPVTAGASTQLDVSKRSPDDNEVPANVCATPATSTYGAGDRGTPGAANVACPTTMESVDSGTPDGGPMCLDTGLGMNRPIVKPTAGALVITEIMADPSAVTDTNGEWFEIMANSGFDLNHLVLGNEGTSTTTVMSNECMPVTANSHVVFAKNADFATNGGVMNVRATFGFQLGNSGNRAVRIVSDGVELDRYSYDASVPGASSQLDVMFNTPADNDDSSKVCPTPADQRYGGVPDAGDRGTPGAVNVDCP